MSNDMDIRPKSKIDTAIIGIVIALVLQGGTAVWWAATTDARIRQLEADTIPLKALPSDVRVLASQMDYVKNAQDRIERKLDRLSPLPAAR